MSHKLTEVVLVHQPESIALRDATRGDGGVLLAQSGEAERAALLKAARAGELTKLVIEAIVYRQTEAPNRNFFRFKASRLKSIARSFKGQPFLRDHEDRNLMARGGTIVASELVDDKGEPAILQVIELVKPWAIEAALDGTLDRFSIGARNTGGDPFCTACAASIYECSHWPGDVVQGKNGETVVEVMFNDAEGVESSCVTVPAVAGTRVEDVRAELSAHRSARLSRGERPTMNKLLQLLLPVLALAETATEEDALGGVELLKTKLEAEKDASAALRARVTELETKLSGVEAAERATATAALVEKAKATGKLRVKHDAQLKPIKGEIEKAIEKLAATSLAAAEEFINDLPVVVPVGRSLATDNRPSKDHDRAVIDPIQQEMNKKLGVSDEDYLNHGPRAQ